MTNPKPPLYQAFPDHDRPGIWLVAATTGVAECYGTTFRGPNAEARAKECAAWLTERGKPKEMDSLARNRLIKCPCCGIFWGEHPTEDSICWRYRPESISVAESTEVARQAGLTVATLQGFHTHPANGNGHAKPTLPDAPPPTAKPAVSGACQYCDNPLTWVHLFGDSSVVGCKQCGTIRPEEPANGKQAVDLVASGTSPEPAKPQAKPTPAPPPTFTATAAPWSLAGAAEAIKRRFDGSGDGGKPGNGHR